MSVVQTQQWSVSITVDSVPLPGVFDKWDGGEIDSDTVIYMAGGMAEPEALPGTPKVGDVTVSRGFRGERDAPLKKFLNGKVGRSIVLGKQALNPDRSPVAGGLEVFSGVLKGVSTPSFDSGGNDVSTFDIVASISGLPT